MSELADAKSPLIMTQSSSVDTDTDRRALAIRDAYNANFGQQIQKQTPTQPSKIGKTLHIKQSRRVSRPASDRKKPKTQEQDTENSIVAFKQDDNKLAADALRGLLYDESEDVDPARAPTSPSSGPLSDAPASFELNPAATPMDLTLEQTLRDRFLQEAYRNEYEGHHSKHHRLILEGGWVDKTDVWKQSEQHKVGRGRVKPTSAGGSVPEGGHHALPIVQETASPSFPFAGVGTGASKSPHPPRSAQDTGTGVYGSEGMISARCDLPAYCHGQYVSLDPDRSPLAVDHPARVWNAMLHSLEPKCQPVVKFVYERQNAAQGSGWQATMTLIFPPSHPALTTHPLASLVPATPYSREYVKVADLLGGTRSWVGQVRKFKASHELDANSGLTCLGLTAQADASNTALVKAIADGAMDWIMAPIMPQVDSGGENDWEASRQVTVAGDAELGSPGG